MHCLIILRQLKPKLTRYLAIFLLCVKKRRLPLDVIHKIWEYAQPIRKPYIKDLDSENGCYLKIK